LRHEKVMQSNCLKLSAVRTHMLRSDHCNALDLRAGLLAAPEPNLACLASTLAHLIIWHVLASINAAPATGLGLEAFSTTTRRAWCAGQQTEGVGTRNWRYKKCIECNRPRRTEQTSWQAHAHLLDRGASDHGLLTGQPAWSTMAFYHL